MHSAYFIHREHSTQIRWGGGDAFHSLNVMAWCTATTIDNIYSELVVVVVVVVVEWRWRSFISGPK
jgi:hypothetical protein